MNEWNPFQKDNVTADPDRTLFVSRLNYKTTEKELKYEFEVSYFFIRRSTDWLKVFLSSGILMATPKDMALLSLIPKKTLSVPIKMPTAERLMDAELSWIMKEVYFLFM